MDPDDTAAVVYQWFEVVSIGTMGLTMALAALKKIDLSTLAIIFAITFCALLAAALGSQDWAMIIVATAGLVISIKFGELLEAVTRY